MRLSKTSPTLKRGMVQIRLEVPGISLGAIIVQPLETKVGAHVRWYHSLVSRDAARATAQKERFRQINKVQAHYKSKIEAILTFLPPRSQYWLLYKEDMKCAEAQTYKFLKWRFNWLRSRIYNKVRTNSDQRNYAMARALRLDPKADKYQVKAHIQSVARHFGETMETNVERFRQILAETQQEQLKSVLTVALNEQDTLDKYCANLYQAIEQTPFTTATATNSNTNTTPCRSHFSQLGGRGCTRPNCAYSHDLQNLHCVHWLKGSCRLGTTCPRFHDPNLRGATSKRRRPYDDDRRQYDDDQYDDDRNDERRPRRRRPTYPNRYEPRY